MTEWKARRFWKEATVAPCDGGWQVLLDGRPVLTPGKQPLRLPSHQLAEAVAAEWEAQGEVIAPLSMPLTRAANSAIEKVAPQFDAVADMLASYGATDLLCYRATAPAELVQAQAQAWDPLIDWAQDRYGIELTVTQGVMPVTQPAPTLAALRARLDPLTPFQLTGLHDLVTLPGSLILGLAVYEGRLDAEQAHGLARVDEDYQSSVWGADAEAASSAAGRLQAMRDAERLLQLLRG
ncbi:ATP12 family chaperone protein [Paracoccus jeotgali]|uniref:ATP12 family chaperone protein n=1 Tax=Paracoccus jeotgali TaxID=2065379 RepID=UPI0028AC9C16|nr:ATP12 family protein [Paracoccus jeotgali]